ncbi:MAG: hypothetical protein HW402_1501 [Dehalococcoidales bacterium]|nr:hypothetical protein [Dehalococcoidales bacterium]
MKSSQAIKMAATVVMAVILTLVGCAKAAPAPAPAPGPAPAPAPTPAPTPTPAPAPAPAPTGPYGSLTVGDYGDIAQFDPIMLSSGVGARVTPLFDLLVRVDDKGALVPGILEKWEIAPDGKSWLYYIRKGIKFHNGEDLNAADVKFSLDRFMSTKAIAATIRTAVERVEIVDDYTVRLYTIGAQPFLPYFSSDYTPALGQVTPKDYLERVGAEYFGLHPVGAGAFKFVRLIQGDMVEYEAYNQHWRQAPAFKKLTQIVMAEETTRVASLRTGLVDIATVSMESANQLEAAGFKVGVLEAEQPAVAIYATYDPRAASMPTADVRVRQALSLAINRDEIDKTLIGGKGGPTTPPLIYGGTADIDRAYWQEYCAKAYRYDPAEAMRLLKEAGYPQGFTFKLFTANKGLFPQLAEVVQGYWQRIGVKAELVPVDYTGVVIGQMYRGINLTYAAAIGQAIPRSVALAPIAGPRLVANFHSKGGMFLLGTARPDVDKLIDDAQSDVNPAKRKELLAQAIKEIVDSYTHLPISSMPVLVAVAPRVDLYIPPGGGRPSLHGLLELAKHR